MPTTFYKFERRVEVGEVFDRTLEAYGIREFRSLDSISERRRVLTDGYNFVWVYADENAGALLTRYGYNEAHAILKALGRALITEIFADHEPMFWGFKTREEWDASTSERVRGEGRVISAGTVDQGLRKRNDVLLATMQSITDCCPASAHDYALQPNRA